MTERAIYIPILLVSLMAIASCEVDVPLSSEADPYMLDIPDGFPYPEIPGDNPLTPEKIALGKKLFYDPALSLDSTISCGSCHKIANAFADHVAVSPGVGGLTGFRNAPSLANVAWYPVMTMDGGNPTLETQPYIPIESHEEMAFNMVLLSERLSADQEYVQLFQDVFGRNPDPFGITRALATFQRTIMSGNSRFDQYYFQGNVHALTPSEKNGMDLFFSDALGCRNCHSDFLFTNSTFQNNGFFENYDADPGRARITTLQEDIGKFRVPSLRNVGVTGPYMHNGAAGTLSAIIDQYAAGGTGHFNQSPLIQPFVLTATEKNELIAFLLSLTDESLLYNGSLYE